MGTIQEGTDSAESTIPQGTDGAEATIQNQGTPDTAVSDTSKQEQQLDKILELDSLDKFRFDGREWTPKDLRNAYLMHSDYTKKAMEVAEYRKNKDFWDYLDHDLSTVSKNPGLAAEFRKTYPQSFHSYLDKVLSLSGQQQVALNGNQNPDLSKALEDRLNRMETILFEDKVSAIEKQIENKFVEMSAKYPLGRPKEVEAAADFLLREGHKVSDKTWEDLWKESHEDNKKVLDSYQKGMFNKQKSLGERSKDVPSGGGLPGKAPKTFKSFKEAAEAAAADLGV